MMFKGTKKHPAGEFSEIIARQGGRQNAFTARDYTTYFEQLASDRLEIALKLEADRMHNLKLDPGEFRKERDVVVEERRLRVADQPDGRFSERYNTLVYPASPYGHPIIGWPEDLKALQLSDIQDWYRRWYAPGNATLVVVGDVKPGEVFDLAEKYFGPIPQEAVPKSRQGDRLEAPGERRIDVTDPDVDVPELVMAYNVPSAATIDDRSDAYALMVLANVLDGGAGARLAEQVVRGTGLAASAGASYDAVARLDSSFQLHATPSPGGNPAALEKALRGQIQRLRDKPVSDDELARAKSQLLADHLFQLDSVFYQAMQIGMLETTGIGWRELEHFQDGVNAVSASDIQDAARRYLTSQRLTVAVLRPQQKAQDNEEAKQ
jgi:zinc protease